LPIAIGDSVVHRIEQGDPFRTISHRRGAAFWRSVDCFEETFVARAIGLGFVVVVTYAAIRWTTPGLYWVDFALLVATVLGIGAVVADGGGERPFITASVVSFLTILCLESLALTTGPAPEVMPSPITVISVMVTISLVTGAMTGAVALGLRSLRSQWRTRR
jgi:hypothetical protein